MNYKKDIKDLTEALDKRDGYWNRTLEEEKNKHKSKLFKLKKELLKKISEDIDEIFSNVE